MPDLFETFLTSPLGKALAPKVGLPQPVTLRRGRVLPSGGIALASLPGAGLAAEALRLLEIVPVPAVRDDPEARVPDAEGRPKPPRYEERIGALVIDASTLTRIDELEHLRAWLRPAVRGVQPSGRIVLVAPEPESADGVEKRAVFHAVDGLNRSLGKELRHGVTTNLVYVAPGVTAAALTSTLLFLLEGRSAFVDGQSWRVGPADVAATSARALAGLVVVVTGAARGIGARIAEVAARDGAHVVAVDVPQAGEGLAEVANTLRGSALQLDITAPDAAARIAAHVAQTLPGRRLHAIVHNAGITRDKLLANMDESRWAAVLEVNLAAQVRINDALLDAALPGGLADGGRIVGVSSTSGIAGNRGQTNYGASKAGVVGVVRYLAPRLADRGITVNAVAPGFIETDMTAAIPPVSREIFRRTNSLQQGGQPVDVAETIGYFLDPASAGVTGQVIRVCGQNLVGA
ncbi:3-oxoacyl-ACP reductase [Propionicicella superfundia]|uniref:3-oxoacyl-ACP reductase n=1 Tax=Propionicicella superfundia TaxID=348582 RepID=UPI00041EFCFD|nr:3-oxoacyl-ACP reductase [Propionicicella superfundia]